VVLLPAYRSVCPGGARAVVIRQFSGYPKPGWTCEHRPRGDGTGAMRRQLVRYFVQYCLSTPTTQRLDDDTPEQGSSSRK
jgi:hypothetical protein